MTILKMIDILRSSIPYLESCDDNDFRVELVFQAIDGLTDQQIADLLAATKRQVLAEAEE